MKKGDKGEKRRQETRLRGEKVKERKPNRGVEE